MTLHETTGLHDTQRGRCGSMATVGKAHEYEHGCEKDQRRSHEREHGLFFYGLEVTPTMVIEQLSECAFSGQLFTRALRTSTRRNNSPILREFTPRVYSMMTTEPKTAFESFITWVNMIMSMESNGTAAESDVVLVAHNGMSHDHVILFRTMML